MHYANHVLTDLFSTKVEEEVEVEVKAMVLLLGEVVVVVIVGVEAVEAILQGVKDFISSLISSVLER